jgi:hypothetical protein
MNEFRRPSAAARRSRMRRPWERPSGIDASRRDNRGQRGSSRGLCSRLAPCRTAATVPGNFPLTPRALCVSAVEGPRA